MPVPFIGPLRLVEPPAVCNNEHMILIGHIQNGVVVLDGETTLPEGTRVSVEPAPKPVRIITQANGLPLVVGGPPGHVWGLTNAQIAELMDEENASS